MKSRTSTLAMSLKVPGATGGVKNKAPSDAAFDLLRAPFQEEVPALGLDATASPGRTA